MSMYDRNQVYVGWKLGKMGVPFPVIENIFARAVVTYLDCIKCNHAKVLCRVCKRCKDCQVIYIEKICSEGMRAKLTNHQYSIMLCHECISIDWKICRKKECINMFKSNGAIRANTLKYCNDCAQIKPEFR